MAKAILLAEDSEDDAILFKQVVDYCRVENPVMNVRDGTAAIAYLEGSGDFADRSKYPLPGILVLDIRMPGGDGFSVLQWLEKNPAIKSKLLVIVLSGFGEVNQIRRAYDLGANSFLTKPFTQQDLENLIRHFDGRWKRATA
jgi:CheY-like chemotaxis protein